MAPSSQAKTLPSTVDEFSACQTKIDTAAKNAPLYNLRPAITVDAMAMVDFLIRASITACFSYNSYFLAY
jgi:hypothetical protein